MGYQSKIILSCIIVLLLVGNSAAQNDSLLVIQVDDSYFFEVDTFSGEFVHDFAIGVELSYFDDVENFELLITSIEEETTFESLEVDFKVYTETKRSTTGYVLTYSLTDAAFAIPDWSYHQSEVADKDAQYDFLGWEYALSQGSDQVTYDALISFGGNVEDNPKVLQDYVIVYDADSGVMSSFTYTETQLVNDQSVANGQIEMSQTTGDGFERYTNTAADDTDTESTPVLVLPAFAGLVALLRTRRRSCD